MATIVLDYDERDTMAKKTLDYILSLGVFEKRTTKKELDEHRIDVNGYDPFTEVRGIWADRDIDGTTLRKQAWGIEP
jgi:hypothetical protein